MVDSISLQVRLRAYIRREKGKRWVAGCPSVGVVTQGADEQDARRSLQEAIGLWFESCIERGTLERALQELGFRPSLGAGPIEPSAEAIRIAKGDPALLGEPTEVTVDIPAYQAAALLTRPDFAVQ